ncbi:MAG TPA: DEAD/DEAH box helicase [Nitrososphaeraceae archaeon]|nr:DEAD/DEAH box helicase [Nitrososphaeraceae archaeon]
MKPAILGLRFPFELTKDQLAAVDSWVLNAYRGSIIYSTGTGKTEIAFECARRKANENYFCYRKNNISDSIRNSCSTSNDIFPSILFLVPRITLIEQNLGRFLSYCVPRESLGVFFGECKEVREITISTYQSVINNLELIHNADTIIFDEMHLLTDSATTLSRMFSALKERENDQGSTHKALLGLTATIDEEHPNYHTIITLLPPVKKYMIKDAVQDGRLAKPILIAIKAKLTAEEKNLYHTYTNRIRNISNDLNISDPTAVAQLLRRGGISARLASSWFENVRNRKNLVNSAENKIAAAVELISLKHPLERIMVFSETIDSIKKLKNRLENEKGIKSMIIESKLRSKERQAILSKWGVDFYVLLSVHTLEIGYDVPQVRIAIILASTSNMNQAAQRVGRILRKSEGKRSALIYTVYLSDTHDYAHLDIVRQATRLDDNKQEIESRVKGNSQTSANTRNTKLDSFTG